MPETKTIPLSGIAKGASAMASEPRYDRRDRAGPSLHLVDADLRPGERRHHRVAFARDRRGRHVDDRHDVLLLLTGVAQRRQGIGGLMRA